MKSIYTLVLVSLISFAARAQNFTLTFEDTSVINQVFYTDSILDSAGIWQIGVPNKSGFDSAYSPPNAIVTLLDSALPPNVNASFIIAIPDTIYYPYASLLTFTHKFDFDSLHGGGYVEFSLDSGIHWHSVLMPYAYESYQPYFCFESCHPIIIDSQYVFGPPMWWNTLPNDTTSNGINYFTGTNSSWVFDTIVMPAGCAVKTNLNTRLLFRFTSFSDSTQTSYHAGWMIDNIGFTSFILNCPGGINEINSSHIKVYPDPVTDGFTVSLVDAGVHDYSISVLDLTGRLLLYRDESGPEATLSRDCIAAGSYVIQVRDRETGTTMEKQVVFE